MVTGPPPEEARPVEEAPPEQPVARADADEATAPADGSKWWLALCAGLAVFAGLVAATGRLDHAAAAVVVGAAVVSAPARPRRALAIAGVGALGGIALAALLERPAPLAGVAVAAAAAHLALSPRGRGRSAAAGLLVAAVAGALALRAAGPESVGGPVDEVAAGVLVLAALAAAYLALPQHGGPPAQPTAAVVVAALGVSALGATDVGTGLAAAALIAAFALALDRRPAAALVAAALGCAATPALAAGPLALAAAAVAAALAPAVGRGFGMGPGSGDPDDGDPAPRPRAWGLDPAADASSDLRDQDDEADENDEDDEDDRGSHPGPKGTATARPTPAWEEVGASATLAMDGSDSQEGPGRALPVWTTAVAALPAGAAALNVAAGRSPAAVLAVAAVAVAVGLPALLDRDAGQGPTPQAILRHGALPGALLAVLTLTVPSRVGWVGDALAHWPTGVGVAAVGLAVALVASPRSRPGRAAAPPRTRPPAAAGPSPPVPARRPGATDGPERRAPELAGGRETELESEPVEAPRSAMTGGRPELPPSRTGRRRRRS